REFIGGRSIQFGSWGAYDRNQFRHDASYHGVALPLGEQHINLKQEFSRRRGTKKRFGMAGALRAVGLPLVGTHHRGIDDARNITRLLPHCVSPRRK
ncbi:MAG: 3'-5' exonuclease, partial [Myxococcota bacterium]